MWSSLEARDTLSGDPGCAANVLNFGNTKKVNIGRIESNITNLVLGKYGAKASQEVKN
jgi:hypothetical protein